MLSYIYFYMFEKETLRGSMFPTGKRGWLRILEAVIAVLILSSVLVVLYTNKTPQRDESSIIYNLQVKILDGIASNANLRNATLYSNETYIESDLDDYVDSKVPKNYNYSIRVCSLSNTDCSLQYTWAGEIYAEDRIISSNLEVYEPKFLRLFIWVESRP